MTTTSGATERLQEDRAHPARLYDYFLGGRTNFPVDRAAAAQSLQANPNTMIAARENRGFMQRATRYVAEHLGIRQFLDIGSGIPTEPNLHQIARRLHPASRVVYADRDPLVTAYAQRLLAEVTDGTVGFVEADASETERILQRAGETLDFDEPVGLSLVALFHFLADADDPYGVCARLVAALPSGSALALTHATADFDDDAAVGTMRQLSEVYAERGITLALRDRAETERFFTANGLRLVDPGLAASCDWRTDLEEDARLPGMSLPAEAGVWAGVGVKP